MNTLTTRQVAATVGFSPTAIRHNCRWGRVPGAHKERGRWVIPYNARKGLVLDWRDREMEVWRGFTRVSQKERLHLAGGGRLMVSIAIGRGKRSREMYRANALFVYDVSVGETDRAMCSVK